MISVPFECMAGKKGKFLHIRSDEELHAALKAAADRSCRKDTDQARYLLRLALGLQTDEAEMAEVKTRLQRMTAVSDSNSLPRKGGTSR